MPYMREIRGNVAECRADTPRAFWVSDNTVTTWRRYLAEQGTNQPTDWRGRRVRPYPAMDVAAHPPFAREGIYTDHRDPQVERAAYELRDRMIREGRGTPGQATLADLAGQFNLRHWRDAYNVVRNVGRRQTGENGRDVATGELRWRAWNNTWSPTATATVDATAPTSRHFGIEIEFDWAGDSYDLGRARTAIGEESRAAGLTFVDRWGSYGRSRDAGWQGTYDSTVGGGEIISDILAGDEASINEALDMIRRVKRWGGIASRRQGMHVHHDVRDFDRDAKVLLVENLRDVQDLLMSFVAPYRRTGTYSAAMSAASFDENLRLVRMGRQCSNSHYGSFNFGHLETRGSIEFRSLGYTLNTKNVRTWIRVGQAIMVATKAGIVLDGSNLDAFLAQLRQHGLSNWAANAFKARCIRQYPALAA